MDFRIADTFTDSLARLTGEEQKAVKTTAFDLQLNPANPGMQFHKLEKARDKRFWSVRVNSDIRLIVHRTESSLLMCHVAHHDDAYRWAERREWEQVVDAWQLDTWDAYRDVMRLGRKTRLPEKQRAKLWSIFERVRSHLRDRGLITCLGLFRRLAHRYAGSKNRPFDFIVVDEAQDVSVAQLRFLAALGGGRTNSLFFTGDLGQRIFQQPFSWKALGVDIRGRSRTLRINYRTSHQIRMQADRLLEPELSDVDGNTELRRTTISVFNGPVPTVETYNVLDAEIAAVSRWLKDRRSESVEPHEIGVIVRSSAELDRACAAVNGADLPFKILDQKVEVTSSHISVRTMHLAKGLEFRAVVVMACDDEVISLQERIETVADSADLEEVYNTERHLLYVACTRARDHLLVTGVARHRSSWMTLSCTISNY